MPFAEADTLSWVRDLYRLSHSTASRGPQQLPALMLGFLAGGFEADQGCLATRYDSAQPGLMITATHGDPPRPIGSLVTDEDSLLGLIVGRGRFFAPADLPESAATCARSCGAAGSALCWPMVIDNQKIGALCLRRRPGQSPFTAQDVERGTTLTTFLSTVIDNSHLHDEQRRRIAELSRANEEVQAVNRRLEDAQSQLLQSEKMASIGQLSAGVAHEINNPIGYVHSNLGSLESYVEDVFRILDAYAGVEAAGRVPAALFEPVTALRRELDIDFLKQDMHALLAETREGIARVKKIVQDLKDFSRAGGGDEWLWADLHKGLESTLNIVNNEIKYKAKVVKEYGALPEIECIPSQLNQVFMNLLVNASHAIETQGVITLRTGANDRHVWVEVADTGCGIPAENLKHIFEPFFTTKPVGQGTGLGLSLSYSIVQKHGGHIQVESEPGRGTTFRVTLPRERVTEPA